MRRRPRGTPTPPPPRTPRSLPDTGCTGIPGGVVGGVSWYAARVGAACNGVTTATNATERVTTLWHTRGNQVAHKA